jgi:predicted NBD/HSP70 family sugar kinase
MSHTVAVDIGGTHIRVAVNQPDPITPVALQRTRSLANEPGVYDRLQQAVEGLWSRGHVAATDVASPGPSSTLQVDYSHNLVATKAAPGDDAGLLGALALARMKSV